jgi:hypothetical protein
VGVCANALSAAVNAMVTRAIERIGGSGIVGIVALLVYHGGRFQGIADNTVTESSTLALLGTCLLEIVWRGTPQAEEWLKLFNEIERPFGEGGFFVAKNGQTLRLREAQENSNHRRLLC